MDNQHPGNEPCPRPPATHPREQSIPRACTAEFSHAPGISGGAGVCGPEFPGPSCPQVMPCLEAVALILLIVLVPDPPRGAAEKQGGMAMGGQRSSWCEDVRYLGRK